MTNLRLKLFAVVAFMAMLPMNATIAQSLEAPLDLELRAYKVTFEPSPLTVEVSWRYAGSQDADISFEVERGFFAFRQPQSEVEYFRLEDAEITQEDTEFLFVDVDAWGIETPCYRVRAVSGGVTSEWVGGCFMQPPADGGVDVTPVVPITGSGLEGDFGPSPIASPLGISGKLLAGSTLAVAFALFALSFVRRAMVGR